MPSTTGTATLAGKPRPWTRGLLLTIVTLGIYAIYWWYKAFKEIYDQERRSDFPTGRFVLTVIPLVSIIGILLYGPKAMAALKSARARVGMPATMSFGKMVVFHLLGIVTFQITTVLAYKELQEEINAYWGAVGGSVSLQPSAPAGVAYPPAAPRP